MKPWYKIIWYVPWIYTVEKSNLSLLWSINITVATSSTPRFTQVEEPITIKSVPLTMPMMAKAGTRYKLMEMNRWISAHRIISEMPAPFL